MARNRKRNSKGRFMGFGRKHSRKASFSRKSRRGKRSRRSFKGFGDMPSFDTLKANVNGHDVLMGAGLGLLGVLAINMYAHDQKLNDKKEQSLNAAFTKDPWKGAAAALVGAAAAGVLGYALMHKGEGGGAWTGRMIGAVGAGIAVAGTRLMDSGYVSKKGYYSSRPKMDAAGAPVVTPPNSVNGYNYGMLYPDAAVRGYGMLTKDPRAEPAALAALSMALDDGNEIERVLGG